MMPLTMKIDPKDPDAQTLRAAADILLAGGLVAFPTETVYGLGALGLKAECVQRIYAAKGRPANNPVILHVSNLEQAKNLASNWTPDADKLAAAFWPGPLTLVLPKSAIVTAIATAGGPTVAIRMPGHPVALKLIDAVGEPLAAPSANKSTEVSPTRARHVADSLGDAVDMILDAGPTTAGIESTVIDLSGPHPILLRPGPIMASTLKTLLGRPVLAKETMDDDKTALPSPGMMRRHYAPKTKLKVYGKEGDLKAYLTRRAQPKRYGLLLIDWLGNAHSGKWKLIRRLPADPAGYAAELFNLLRELDQEGLNEILVQAPPDSEEWQAIRDRLKRAAAK